MRLTIYAKRHATIVFIDSESRIQLSYYDMPLYTVNDIKIRENWGNGDKKPMTFKKWMKYKQ